MGCLPDKIKKETRDIHQHTQTTQNVRSVSGTPFQVTPQKGKSSQKQCTKAEQKSKKQGFRHSGAGYPVDQHRNDGIQQLINKYKITTKQSMYKTNSIHSYPYRKLVVFNPPQDNIYSSEKEILEKSYNFNLSRELVSNSKVRFSKK